MAMAMSTMLPPAKPERKRSVSPKVPSPKAKELSHVVAGPQLPSTIPAGFALATNETAFDAAVHLSIEDPEYVFTSDFEQVSFPYSSKKEAFSLGYTAPFKLLSEEGTRVLRGILEANDVHCKSYPRIPKCLRGLAYRSQFVRDMTFSPAVVNMVSSLAGKPLAPHGMHMNVGHTNFGRKVNTKNGEEAVIVDQWHVDSVDYVMVLILSDLSKMVGGELEVLHVKGVRDNNELLQKGIGPEQQQFVRKAPYPGPGSCVLMQGSQILHRVAPVLFADEARISCVTSFMSRNIFDHDSTRYDTFKQWDPEHVSTVEYARHQAWRVGGIMQYMQEKVKWDTPAEEIVGLLRDAAATLNKTARLLDGTEDDALVFIDHKKVQAKFEPGFDPKKVRSKL